MSEISEAEAANELMRLAKAIARMFSGVEVTDDATAWAEWL
jgi:hypothetical protein